MKDFILPTGSLFIILLAITTIVGVQVLVADVGGAWTRSAKEPCAFKSWSDANGVQMVLDCNGKRAWTNEADLIIEYIAKPGPLACSYQWINGKAYCKMAKTE